MQCDSRKVSIIGGGKVGLTAAYAIVLERLVDELVIISRDAEKLAGEKLDLEHGMPFLDPLRIVTSSDYAAIAGSDIVIVTAGAAQEPGETRLDLAAKNVAIIKEIIPKIVAAAPESVIVIVTNPVDVLTYHATKLAQVPAGRVFGSGTMLDTARLRHHLSEFLDVNPKSIHAYVLGEHGDSSFPAFSSATVGGQPLSTFPGYTPEKGLEAFAKARDAASKIIATKGATFYAIGVVIAQIVRTILNDQRTFMPVSSVIDNYYGQSDVAVSVPCIVGRGGIKRTLTVQLSESEQSQFGHSCEVVRDFCK